MKRLTNCIWPLLLLSFSACHSPSQATNHAQSATDEATQPQAGATKQAQTAPSAKSTSHAPTYHAIDMKSMNAASVNVYNGGYDDFVIEDITPILSDASSYSQKWEFYIYTRPYQTRIKFEISNFAFSKNEGKVKGYVKKFDGDKEIENYPISKSLKSGQWKASKSGLELDFGGYKLAFKDNAFHISGHFDDEKATFEYVLPTNTWKPGTGNVYFGNSENNVFKYSILTYQKPVTSGIIHKDGTDTPVTGTAYGNHYAATIAVYDMFDEVADSRKYTDDVFVEFRYYVPSAKYNAAPFGFLMVAFEGTPIFSASEINRTPLETWIDDKFYSYEIDSRQQIEATDADNPNNSAILRMTSAEPEPSDPYANLPAFQRNVASRFAKPVEYSIPIEYELDIDADGYKAKITVKGSYSMTRLR